MKYLQLSPEGRELLEVYEAIVRKLSEIDELIQESPLAERLHLNTQLRTLLTTLKDETRVFFERDIDGELLRILDAYMAKEDPTHAA